MPRKFVPNYNRYIPGKVKAYMRQGMSKAQVCVELKISKKTFDQWCKEYPPMLAAYEIGETLAEAWWEDYGLQGMKTTKKCNSSIWSFTMKNRFGWKDRNETNTNVKGEVKVKEVPDSELDRRLTRLINKTVDTRRKTNTEPPAFDVPPRTLLTEH